MNISTVIVLLGVVAFGVFVLFLLAFINRKTSKLDREFYEKKWRDIVKLAENESGWVQAVIEADKLLDDALKKSGYKGKTMGERLVSASRAFTNKDKTWAAHKLRNKVVHETSVKLRSNHVRGAIRAFGRSLKDLGAL